MSISLLLPVYVSTYLTILYIFRPFAIPLDTSPCYTKTTLRTCVTSGSNQSPGRDQINENMHQSLACHEAVCHSSTEHHGRCLELA